jgi:hypothetical protein
MSRAVKSAIGCKKIMKSALLLLAFFLFVVCATAKADMNWDGDGTSGYFSWWNNWYGNNFPTTGFGSGNLNFNFQNTGISTGLVNDVGWKDIDNIYWNSTYGAAMTLSGATGNGIAFKQKLENLSNFTQTVTMDLSGGKNGATAIELNPVNGNLTVSGNLYNDFSNDYLVYGTTGKTLTLNTTLGVGNTAANVDFSVEQASNVQVNSNQTYGGNTRVKAGSFKTGASVTLASSGIVVSGGTFETTSADVVVNTGTVNVSSGEYKLGGNDSVASLTISGGLLSSANASTLTAATYALQGGTVSANLGTGTVNATSGATLLSGTSAAANVNVQGGLLTLASVNRLADTAAVAVSSGELAVGANDTVGSLSTTGGTVSGAGTLTAATYALNGGTVSANLGAGTVNASSGTTLLSGTSAAANVNVSGGLLSLVSANRLADAAAVAVSSGELAVGANDTVGSLSTTGGTVSGTGILTAATYALNGGTVSANLGAGTVNASSGTTLLSGTSAAANVNVTGGTLNTSGANKLADGAAVVVSSGTLGVGGSDTVGSLAASGTGVVTVATGTTLTANGNSSITGSARATGGTVAVANNSLLNLANSSTTTTSDLSIGSGSTLAGTGGTSGQIKGSGLLSPGNSPGILTSGSVDLTDGIDFAFEFTAAGAPTYSLAGNSRNDLLHLTSGSTPFSGSFSTGNTVSFYFNDAGLSASLASGTPTTYLGGFFVDAQNFDIAGLLSSASLQYFIAAANGTTSFNGVNYNLMSNEVASGIILSNVNQSGADFTTGTVDGTVLSVVAVPEPSSASLLLAGMGSLLVLRRFRKTA